MVHLLGGAEASGPIAGRGLGGVREAVPGHYGVVEAAQGVDEQLQRPST